MDSHIHVFPHPNGEIQRVQLVQLEDWDRLDFLFPAHSPAAFERFCHIYRQYLVPGFPWVFGTIVLFCLPEDLEVPFPFASNAYGTFADPLTAAALALKRGVRFLGKKPIFRSDQVKAFWQALQQRSCLQIVRGKLPITTVIPIGRAPGFLSETEVEARVKVNGSFFIMDPFDCATAYDHVGTHLGLLVKDGRVQNPPLYAREALLVRQDGRVNIEAVDVTQLQLELGGRVYVHGKNATIYSRPHRARTPSGKGKKLVIVGCRVVAVCDGGSVPIPASGFVLCPQGECAAQPGDPVVYRGLEDVYFGIQVGNSILRGGEKTTAFRSRFYNIRALERIPFPPSLYPMDFNNARAARIALGADSQGKPILLWAEGAGKLSYTPGKDSCGATLADMATICSRLGMVNAINLDGGGSAQMLLRNRRSLLISDRKDPDRTESERPVPMGLIVR